MGSVCVRGFTLGSHHHQVRRFRTIRHANYYDYLWYSLAEIELRAESDLSLLNKSLFAGFLAICENQAKRSVGSKPRNDSELTGQRRTSCSMILSVEV